MYKQYYIFRIIIITLQFFVGLSDTHRVLVLERDHSLKRYEQALRLHMYKEKIYSNREQINHKFIELVPIANPF